MRRKFKRKNGKNKGISGQKKTLLKYRKLLENNDHTKLLKQLHSVNRDSKDHLIVYIKSIALHKTGRLDEALEFIEQALHLQPENLNYIRFRGRILEDKNLLIQAIHAYSQVVDKEPTDYETYYKMGLLLEKIERFDQAIICFKKAIEEDSNKQAYLRHIGFCFYSIGELKTAAHYYEQAVSCEGNTSLAWVLIGTLFMSKGEKENAAQAFRKALEIDPQCYLAYPNYVKSASLHHHEIDSLIKHLEVTTKNTSLQPADKRFCHFSLGELYHNQKKYDLAFEHFKNGNKYRAEVIGTFNPQALVKELNWYRKHFSKSFFDRNRGLNSFSSKPVFIVGMPRSGTTLIEQIVASHELGFGAGELSTIKSICTNLGAGELTESFFTRLKQLNAPEIDAEAIKYLEQLERYNKKATRIVDKMPHNQQFLWCISLLFPQAPIIHCQRDPLDTCLSCFFTDFNSGHNYKENLYSLGEFYSIFSKFMDHWKKVVPNPILTVQYEELIESTEKLSRKIIKHIGLHWDSNCLELRDRGHFSQTASNLQIRKGIYKTSIKRWKRYENYLDPLKKGLAVGENLC